MVTFAQVLLPMFATAALVFVASSLIHMVFKWHQPDYRALSNAGLWCVGRLQTDADRARVVDGLSAAVRDLGMSKAALAAALNQMIQRWFVVRDANSKTGAFFMQPRYAMSLLRGPMTRAEVRRAREERARGWPVRQSEAAE